ncbi:MAG: exosortase-associated EpsI family protein [Phycisphaerales bacterium]|nr:exosortase-associated EpsI family protein [Phycisphaerales bacterium]
MRFEPTIKGAFAAVVIVLITSAVGFRAGVSALEIHLRKEAVPLRESLDTIPTKLGRWKRVGEDAKMGEAMIESLGTKFYLDRQYELDGDPAKGRVSLHIAYYTGMVDAVPHVPERCWGAAGLSMVDQPTTLLLPVDRSQWIADSGIKNAATGEAYPQARVIDPVTRREEKVLLPVGQTEVSVTVFQDEKTPEVRLVGGYLFIANGRLTPSPYVVRTYAFDLSNRYAYYCKVQFSAFLPDGDKAVDRWKALSADLLTELLPILMRRLPDWATLESSQPQDT